MIISKKKIFPYSLIFIEDLKMGDVPESMDGRLVAFTDSCIAVGCLPEVDGATHVILGWEEEVSTNEHPVFNGSIVTELKTVTIRTAERDIIAKMKVKNKITQIIIWANHPSEPDEIRIGIVKI